MGSGPRFLAEHLHDHNRIGIDPVDDPPCRPAVLDTEFVTPSPQQWQRPGDRHTQRLAALEESKMEACFESGFSGEGRCLDLSVKTSQRLVSGTHRLRRYVILDILSSITCDAAHPEHTSGCGSGFTLQCGPTLRSVAASQAVRPRSCLLH